MYKALYRVWRPNNFEQVVGQQHIVKTLRNAVRDNKISHAYLMVGPRGTGKTSIARIFAKAVNCSACQAGEPCGACDNCLSITDGSNMDVYEMDAASNRGIDEVRDIVESVRFSPASSRYKVYIIDEVHMLTNEAFNALLKTLEEPPAHVIFVLCTTDVQKVPATILSRCQRYDFRKLPVPELEKHLKNICESEKIRITGAALTLICEHAAGGVRDALSILDQCAILDNNALDEASVRELLGITAAEQLEALYEAVIRGNCAEIYSILDDESNARDIRQLFADFLKHAYTKMRVSVDQGDAVQAEHTARIIQEGAVALNDSRWNSNAKFFLEAAIIRMALSFESGLEAKIPLEVKTPERYSKPEEKPKPAAKVVARPAIQNEETPVLNNTVTAGKSEEPGPAAQLEECKEQAVDGAVKSELTEIWENALNELRKMNKRLVVECAKNARLIVLNDDAATIAFETADKFFKERLEKTDYSKQVETALQQIVKHPVKLDVVYITAQKKADKTKVDVISDFFGIEIKTI